VNTVNLILQTIEEILEGIELDVVDFPDLQPVKGEGSGQC